MLKPVNAILSLTATLSTSFADRLVLEMLVKSKESEQLFGAGDVPGGVVVPLTVNVPELTVADAVS